MNRRKAIADKWSENLISKTYSVFVIATFGLFMNRLSGSEWSALAIFYVVGEKGIAIIKLFKPQKEEIETVENTYR